MTMKFISGMGLPLRRQGSKNPARLVILFSLLLSTLVGCENSASHPQDINPIAAPSKQMDAAVKEITLKTADGWMIVGDLYTPADLSKGAVILLHQRSGSAKDWKPLCLALQKSGYTALALDQRGAGRSTKGPGPFGDDAPWPTSGDIAAAIAYLKPKAKKNIGLVGASYGANNALIYAAGHPDQVSGIALYSPGENYHGLEALPAARIYSGPLVVFYARNDAIAGNGPQQILSESASSDKLPREYDDRVHGTALLNNSSVDDTVAFFQRLIK